MDAHALFATVESGDPSGETITFRIGQPARTFGAALARYGRLWADGAIDHGKGPGYCRPVRVRYARRWYRVRFMEVRATDRHGRGLGSERHGRAIPVPYRAAEVIR